MLNILFGQQENTRLNIRVHSQCVLNWWVWTKTPETYIKQKYKHATKINVVL